MAGANEDLNQLDSTFMYTEILKEIILSIEFEEKHIKQFIAYCRNKFAQNASELKKVDELEKKYHDETPIWWYTYGSFLRVMINQALQQMDTNIITKMGFFVRDLHCQIEKLHSKQQSGKVFTVYRGEGLAKTDFDQLMRRKGGLISYNQFLSTSKNREASLDRAQHVLDNPNQVGVLFVMKIDPSKSTIPFASIGDVSSHQNTKDEILFSMHTIFRIVEIKPLDDKHRLFQVDLALTNEEDKDLRFLSNRIREEIFQHPNGWQRLSSLLSQIGQFDQAQEINEGLLEQSSGDGENESTYKQLAENKYYQGDYEEAIKVYEKLIDIQKQAVPLNYSNLVTSYNSIGQVYSDMDDYFKALSHYENVLEIQQKTIPPDHPEFAISYTNVGSVYDKMGDYSKALSHYEKALQIHQKSLPPGHPNLGNSYNDIGSVYINMEKYPKALSYYEMALAIKNKTLPPGHPELATSYTSMGALYDKMGQYSKSLSFYERALDITQQSMPPGHPSLQDLKQNIETLKKKL